MTIQGIEKLIASDWLSKNKKKYFMTLKDSIEKNNIFDEEKFKKNIEYIKTQDSMAKLQFKDCLSDLYSLIESYF